MIDNDAVTDYLSGCGSAVAENEVAQIRQEIDNRQSRNAEFTQAITSNLTELRLMSGRLDRTIEAANDPKYREHVLAEWSALSSHPRLVSAEVAEGTLILITTDDIRLHRADSEDTRWLGAFRITLTLDAGAIDLRNLHTRRGGRDHPHVVNGNPCFGANHAAFAQLLAAGDLFVLFELLIQYLETLNLEDEYGRYGAYWFDAPDAQPIPELDLEVSA